MNAPSLPRRSRPGGRSARRPARAARRQPLPKGFFGIVPQTALPRPTPLHEAGGIESVRVPVPVVGDPADARTAATTGAASTRRSRSPPAPGCGSCPSSRHAALAGAPSRRRCRSTAAEQRSGLGGLPQGRRGALRARRRILEPARARRPRSTTNRRSLGPMPIREWQIWNEANFFYFAYPVSPAPLREAGERSPARRSSPSTRSAKVDPLRALRRTDREGGKRGCRRRPSSSALYRVPGIKADFDGVALHPYAVDTRRPGRTGRGDPRR